jgi:hypothetical protein
MYRNKFLLKPANDYIWNQQEFVDFLIDNQGQPITVDTNQEGVDLYSSGVYKLLEQFKYQNVTVITNNLIESHPSFQILHQNPFKFFELSHSDYTQYHCWNRKKIFACLYNRPLWYRVGLAAEMQCSYNDISVINLRANPHDVDERKLFEIQKLFENAPGSFNKFAQVSTTWPKQLEHQDGYTKGNNTNGHTDQLAYLYPDFLIDIVAETWTQGHCFFPTEKTVRPMLLKKPMIVMASANYLEHLRQMGFRTFGDFWDEDYDGYEGADRYNKILKLIDKLSQLSVDQLETMYWDMQYTLDHNYNLLAAVAFSRTITHVI